MVEWTAQNKIDAVCNGMIVNHPRLFCPRCHSKLVFVVGTKQLKEGTLRYHNCHSCFLKFKSIEKP